MDRAKPIASCLTQQLTQQFEIAWQLTEYHLSGLTTEECLWRPAERGLHVLRGDDHLWRAQWPEHEGYDLGPAGWRCQFKSLICVQLAMPVRKCE